MIISNVNNFSDLATYCNNNDTPEILTFVTVHTLAFDFLKKFQNPSQEQLISVFNY